MTATAAKTRPATYFTSAEAADYIRVSVDVIKKAVRGGALRAKVTGPNGGGKYLIRRDDLDAWFDSLDDA